MKKLLFFLCITFLFLVLIRDLTITHKTPTLNTKQVKVTPFKTTELQPDEDETVFSIIESLHENKRISKSTKEMMHDFKVLNPQANPFQLDLKQTYIFPIYEK